MAPFGWTLKAPGSVPLGIHEKVTRSSITRKNGRSAIGLALALAGRSAALAEPVEASAAIDTAAAGSEVRARGQLCNSGRPGPAAGRLLPYGMGLPEDQP